MRADGQGDFLLVTVGVGSGSLGNGLNLENRGGGAVVSDFVGIDVDLLSKIHNAGVGRGLISLELGKGTVDFFLGKLGLDLRGDVGTKTGDLRVVTLGVRCLLVGCGFGGDHDLSHRKCAVGTQYRSEEHKKDVEQSLRPDDRFDIHRKKI